MMTSLLLQIVTLVHVWTLSNCFLTDETSVVFGTEANGLIAAFGDYNSDKLIDLFVITDKGKGLQIYFASNELPGLRPFPAKYLIENGIITSVVPGDYDGDSQMDVLITIQHNPPDLAQEFRIIWGNLYNLTISSDLDVLNGTILGQPLVFDYNGDRIPDLFGETVDHQRKAWIMSTDRKFQVQNMSFGSNEQLRIPHSHTFIDLNNDMAADLLVTTNRSFETWYNEHGVLKYQPELTYRMSKEVAIIGQSVIIDIDMDGKMDHIVPVCFDAGCLNSSILIYKNKMWIAIEVNFQNSNMQWGFIPPTTHSSIAEDTITLRVGDFNMDGYLDFLTVLKSKSGSSDKLAVILMNKENSGGQFHRSLEVIWDTAALKEVKDVLFATFFDIFNTGILDTLVVRGTTDGNWKMMAFRNDYDSMSCFFKVIVSSGLCYTDCPTGKIPYGVNQPGPFVCYKSTSSDGSPKGSCSGLLTQSAHFALQLPFVIFGLGHTPNFVDKLCIGIPYPPGESMRKHEWTNIIPNSQMFVIPYLESDNNRWLNKLFVTPSKLVIITFTALMGVMGLIFFIVVGLHWKERMEDKKEKLQEAHRFHFDAM